jgi:hypothetical protein
MPLIANGKKKKKGNQLRIKIFVKESLFENIKFEKMDLERKLS